MTDTSTRPRTGQRPPRVIDKTAFNYRGGAARADRFFKTLCVGAGLLVLAILALILLSTAREAWPAFREEGLSFVTSKEWVANEGRFGALALIYGTAVVSVIALVIAVPVSIGIALFLTELAPPRLRIVVVTVMDLLAATPSVVFGLWGIIVLAPKLVPVYEWFHDSLGGIPVLGGLFGVPVSNGYSYMTAGIIVAIMIIPIVTSITREVFGTVPLLDKQAALALGATRWEMIKGAVFPHSFGGMVGAGMLGLGRAMGETIAIALVIGAAIQITPNVYASGEAMPSIIVRQWGESSGVHTSALVGLGVVLFAITILVNYIARFVVRRAELKMRGASS
ncbi:phosphate ABC transporter permease subunit PstC [Virgisporangium aurantiacum]|uniref:Phosphate transport system permease protein n=1 Tax=Virgisporangium aurantiacum TaxID=175570 RepID=A0A8J4DY55_9ACTN|nr:phosphate ABC transporter permease subunit PstC [Virgisporangium aurantiacum]GIJ52737.1 phosphate transport system permease protein [Virgisporangium aurantiacum]